jgi:multimeric flavodoxin WrbA
MIGQDYRVTQSRMSQEESPPGFSVRTGQGSTQLTRTEFVRRYREQFRDPAFAGLSMELDRIVDTAWHVYLHGGASPHKQKAGPEFANPDHELSAEWLEARQAIREAQQEHESPASESRILIVCASPRTDETRPGEMSKTFRLSRVAQESIAAAGFTVDFLDLSVLAAEYGRRIYPCKACVSTAMPLCHWPCSCYPNHHMGQTQDWMNELYPRWVAAHGIMIVTPVHWYQAPSVLKLLIDRLVCADGGNPDPTTIDGKDPAKAKAIEIKGWSYPKHLAGRRFSVVVHGDAEGTHNLRYHLHDWLSTMGLVPAGTPAILDRYVGYLESYAQSHEALDRDHAIVEEVRNAARTLIEAVIEMRFGRKEPGASLPEPRPK